MPLKATERSTKPDTTAVDRAVSPVVGVVMMIVLAVSLTVVVGGFTSELVNQADVDMPPEATISTYNDEGSDGIRIAHDGGEDLEFDELDIVVRRANGDEVDSITISEDPSELTPGDTFVVTSGDFTEGTEYEIIVIDENTGKAIDESVVEYRS